MREIGERDSWLCGICQDAERPVSIASGTPRALSPSLDHIVALSFGGAHTRANVRITHLWCNVERNTGLWHSPEYMQARLSQVLNGTPIPEELFKRDRADLSNNVQARLARLPPEIAARMTDPKRRHARAERQEYVILLKIATGQIAPDLRHGDLTTRLAEARQRHGETKWDESVAAMASSQLRLRTGPDGWWQTII